MHIERLFFSVVERGKANAVLRKAKEIGVTAATIFLGRSLIQNTLLEKLGLLATHKEILVIPITSEHYGAIDETFKQPSGLFKKDRSLTFSIPFRRWQQAGPPEADQATAADDFTYFGIFTIVDRGRSLACARAARAAGAKDALLIHGRGAGVPVDFYFPLVIEPQKDIVLVITTKEKAPQVKERISQELELEKVGHGILFTLPVIKPHGLSENSLKTNREEPA
jgi:hypothetical protein